VGKKRDRGIQLIVDEYTEKIRHYCTIDDVLIRSNPKNARYFCVCFVFIFWSFFVCLFEFLFCFLP